MIFQHQEQSHKLLAPSQLCTRLSRTSLHRQLHQTPNQIAILPGVKGRQEANSMSSTICQAARMRTSRSNFRALSRGVLLVLPSLGTHPSLFHRRANGQRSRSSNLLPLLFRHHTKYSYPQQCSLTSRTTAFVYRAQLPRPLWMVV